MNIRAVSSVLIALASVLVAGCGSDGAKSPDEPKASTAASPIEGTWQTRPVSPKDAEATLRDHGLEKWIERFRPVSPIPPDTVLILQIGDGRWDLYGSSNDEPRVEIDFDARYKVTGDTVTASHEGDTNTYRWSIEGSSLSLEWLETTYPPNEGIPEEVFQRALYMTAEFTRE